MPDKEIISRHPDFPFSSAVAYGNLVFVSGTVGRDPNTRQLAAGDIGAQTRQALENVQQQLTSAGSALDKALKVTVFITDMALFGAMNQVYRQFFPTAPPARSCVEVAALPDPTALVEIEIIAGR
jgi:2-iminobutanoate/2-iminopropanoate deaminase